MVLAEGTGHDRVAKLLRQQGAQALVPLKLAQQVAGPLGLVVREVPLEVPPFEVNLFWHERVHRDPGHRWLRERWARLFGAPG